MTHNHRHIVLTARGLAIPPRDEVVQYCWLGRLVDAVNMDILYGPKAVRCDDEGNEGTSGYVMIKTSHASIHVWDEVEEPFAKIDLYSCADFDVQTVLDFCLEFQPQEIEWLLLDRNGRQTSMIESGIIGANPATGEIELPKPVAERSFAALTAFAR
jgi:S-adenosylmethionine/arginine decarboxylase-like enzyme